jgi:hypothetical protein
VAATAIGIVLLLLQTLLFWPLAVACHVAMAIG